MRTLGYTNKTRAAQLHRLPRRVFDRDPIASDAGLFSSDFLWVNKVTGSLWAYNKAQDLFVRQLDGVAAAATAPYDHPNLLISYDSSISGSLLTDSKGNYDGTIYGGIANIGGKVGPLGITTDGIDDWVAINENAGNILTGAFTLNYWVKHASANIGPVFIQGRDTPSLGWSIVSGCYNESNGEVRCYIVTSSPVAQENALAPPSTPPVKDEWYMITLRYDPGVHLQSFYNGELLASNTSLGTGLRSSTRGAMIANGNNGSPYADSPRALAGLDLVYVLNAAISDEETTYLYNGGLGR